ncbi:Bacterial type II secretion system protein F domain protein [Candidatus Bealeia paramacronuclearis]|uniref:Bacterial type II secretion system protein F domain protein n=1 Tax=Candidatus Bealeia paramacronuclearis TaxID=1921001 RepID=A0ABZ2C642_9PROT|nr:Bacterial type II secretion system protein F domain protein [Candidatus Bealeia paramacronuclearis]
MNLDFVTFLLSFVVMVMGLNFVKKSREFDVFKKRLKDLNRHQSVLTDQQDKSAKKVYVKDIVLSSNPFVRMLQKLQFSSLEEQKKIKKMFEKAGWRSENSLLIYMIAKTLAIFPPAIGIYFYAEYFTQWPGLYKLGGVVGAALFGSYAVNQVLEGAIRSRQSKIQQAFPDALDLMVICTEAGLSLNATMQRVAREVGQVYPDLGYELALTSIELNLLPDRKVALQNFSNRLDMPVFRGMISTLIQSEQYGTPIAQTMRVISEEFRLERMMKTEEKAGRIPVLLSLPLAVFILPCIFIVILGPAAINAINTFK